MSEKQLIDEAFKAFEKAYCPYSQFPVGAALETKSGKIISGCNVENAAYPLSTCAERVAITKAISQAETEEDKEIVSIAVAAKKLQDVIPSPCGGCRQIISEFGYKHNCAIIMAKNCDAVRNSSKTIDELKESGHVKIMTVLEMLPEAFLPSALQK